MIQHRVAFDELRAMPDKSFQGARVVIPHWAFMETTKKVLAAMKWQTGELLIDATDDRAVSLFACEVTGHDVRLPANAQLFIGGSNSLMKYRTSRLYCGIVYHEKQVAVFDMSQPMKHEIKAPLEAKLYVAINSFQENSTTYRDRVRYMRTKEVTRAEYNEYLFRAADKAMTQSKRLATLARKYDADETLWSLYGKLCAAAGRRQILMNPKKDRLSLLYETYVTLYGGAEVMA